MTDTMEHTEAHDTDSEDDGKGGRDFTKVRQNHIALAEFVNANSGIDPVSPNQVKAILALRSDFNKLPEQVEARRQRKLEIEAEKKKYEGMSPEQIKAAKAAKRADAAAARLTAKAEEAMKRAEQLKAAAAGDGEALAALVESQTNNGAPETPAEVPAEPVAEAPAESTPEAESDEKPRRRLGRSRS